MIAAVMCGGGATRMKSSIEKPLLTVNGVPMVQRVVSALAKSRRFDRVVAVVSQNTPKTREFLQSKGIETIETAGEGYSKDLAFILSKLTPAIVFVTPADVPLLNTEVIGDIITYGKGGDKAAAVSVVAPKNFVEKLGITPSVLVDLYGNNGKACHSGITIFNTALMEAGKPVKEEYIVMIRADVAVNVNTKEELALAEKLLLVQRAQDLAKDDGVRA